MLVTAFSRARPRHEDGVTRVRLANIAFAP